MNRTLLSVWEEYRKAAKCSRELKRQLNRTRVAVLMLVIAGSLFGIVATQVGDLKALIEAMPWLPQGMAALSAVALLVATYLSKEIIDSPIEKKWVSARSQAEALKSEAFKYLLKAPPYHEQDATDHLAAKTKVLLEDETEPTPVSLSEEEKRRGLPPDWLSVEQYIKQRVEEQIRGFYEPKAVEHHHLMNVIKRIGFILGGIGVVLGVMGTTAYMTWAPAWVAVIGTISGALAAFVFAGRYQYLAISYELTSRRLNWLINDWERVPDSEKARKAGAFILECENAISVENSNWVAEWSKKKPTH